MATDTLKYSKRNNIREYMKKRLNDVGVKTRLQFFTVYYEFSWDAVRPEF